LPLQRLATDLCHLDGLAWQGYVTKHGTNLSGVGTGSCRHNKRVYCSLLVQHLKSMLPIKLIGVRRNYDRDLISGLIRIHVLYHACKAPIFGLDIIEKLQRHEYKLSPGTLYPLLHRLKKRGYLRSKDIRSGRAARHLYQATPAGRKALAKAREKVRELLGELIE